MPSPDEIWAGLTAVQKKALIEVASAFQEGAPAPAAKPAAKPKPVPAPKKKIVKPKPAAKKAPSPRAAKAPPSPSSPAASPPPKKSVEKKSPARKPKTSKKGPVDPKLMKWVGTTVKKAFDGVFYSGKVVKISLDANKVPGMEFYRIKYSDGDSEDVLLEELKSLAVEEPKDD